MSYTPVVGELGICPVCYAVVSWAAQERHTEYHNPPQASNPPEAPDFRPPRPSRRADRPPPPGKRRDRPAVVDEG